MGGVMKWVLAALVLGLVWSLWRARSRIGRAGPRPSQSATRAPALQAMVVCAHCGLHLPGAEALHQGERSYCSHAHRILGPVAR